MKIVQEYLKEADEERLIHEYFYMHPINYEELKDKTELSIKEIKKRIQDNLKAYIKRLQNIKTEPSDDGKTYILYAYKTLKDGFEDVSYSLICLQELIEKGNDVSDYDYSFSKQEEIMGYLISDTDYTQKHIYGVLSDVLYEASLFGFEQEHLVEEKAKIEESIKEMEEGNNTTYSMDELRKKWGIEKEEADEEADRLRYKMMDATIAYEKYCRNKELNKLKENLD